MQQNARRRLLLLLLPGGSLRRRALSSGSATVCKQTPLHPLHTGRGGRMVQFAGHWLPLHYASGIVSEHKHARSSCALFDVSHMLQHRVCGANRRQLLEFLTVADLQSLQPGSACLSLFLNNEGGIIDDVIVTSCEEPHHLLVSNGATAAKVREHLGRWVATFQERAMDVRLEEVPNSLLALQGPRAAEVLAPGVGFDLAGLGFMRGCYAEVFGVPGCRVTRCGYTGMDGFEISVPPEEALRLAEVLLSHQAVQLAGLGARDSLRLEAGLCLYGSDMDESRSPAEASLMWTVSKRRRQEAQESKESFLGSQRVAAELQRPQVAQQRRVGLLGLEGPPARAGASILAEDGGSGVGEVTSGCMSPTLGQPVAMGYVARSHAKVGTPVLFDIRGRRYRGVVAKMPFVPATYYSQRQ